MALSVPNLTGQLASATRELLMQEYLGLYVIWDTFWIGVRRVKDLGLSLGTSVCQRGSQHLQNKKQANKKKKKQNAPNAKNLGLMPTAGTLKVSHLLMLFNPLKHERGERTRWRMSRKTRSPSPTNTTKKAHLQKK